MSDFHIPSNIHPERDSSGLVSTKKQAERALLAHLTLTERAHSSAARATERERAADATRPPEIEEATEEGISLDELAGLADAAGAVVAARTTQRRPKPDPATLFGKGKVEEMKALCAEHDANVVIVDCDLSPAQGKNLEEALKVRVIDRTELILDIFARRAQTAQAKLQIELAQLRYQLPRLKRMWVHLGRTGGGIGTRGPGETQLETDRSMARDRITLLEKQLDTIRKQKKVESSARFEFELGALVGYTNVGKSALLNALSNPTGKKVYEANQLFATLGASTRKVELGNGRSILLSDTVGFVRRLPHFLVESFHSTLNEVENADFLLLVIDAADPEADDKMRSVEKVLNELQVLDTPHLLVLNQCDRLSPEARTELSHRYPHGIFTSALTGEGLLDLHNAIKELLDEQALNCVFRIDTSDEEAGRVLADLARHGRVLEQEWVENSESDGAHPILRVKAKLARRWRDKMEPFLESVEDPTPFSKSALKSALNGNNVRPAHKTNGHRAGFGVVSGPTVVGTDGDGAAANGAMEEAVETR
jgi:GTP-binding protein HflX